VALTLSLAVLAVGSVVIGSGVTMPGELPAATATSAVSAASLSAPAAASGTEEVGRRVTMRVGDQVATATLADTPAGREFAAMLPITVDLQDPFGQAKSGALPHPIDIAGAAAGREFHPITRGIYYWPDGGDLAVFYDALGQAVPPPGLVHLGSVDTGLDAIAARGDVTVTIRRAD
jgi:hypothetical protein